MTSIVLFRITASLYKICTTLLYCLHTNNNTNNNNNNNKIWFKSTIKTRIFYGIRIKSETSKRIIEIDVAPNCQWSESALQWL